jgi:chromate reductase, NAD(P)H dehydrogenase (quinone)
MQILAISGSLRGASSNTSLMQAATIVAPEGVRVVIYNGLDTLPYFNPDLDGEGAIPPATVAELRRQVEEADGVLISSPEYAHGVPGVLKNGLDWLVSSGETVGKHVALVNASPRATHAQESLAETLSTMAAIIVPQASIAVPLSGRKLDASGIASDPEISALLRSAIATLVEAIEESRVVPPAC